MPTYEFEDREGRYVALDLPIGTAPLIGTSRRIGGRVLTRIPSRPIKPKVAPNVGFSSLSLPLNWPYAPRHNEKGEAVFHSKREVSESLARAQHDGEKVIYE